MNRRTFLKTTALCAASHTLAFGDAPNKIRCGILGIDHAHGLDVLKVLQQSPDFELVGVCEPEPEVKTSFASNPALNNVRWLSQEELLADPSIKMIAIESGVPRLLDLARAAIDAGKHIHLDKPAGASLPTFRSIMNDAEQKKLLVQMGYMFRYNPGFDFIRRAVREKWLGDIYTISASMCTDLNAEKRARIAAYSGGIMFELGCHLIDMIVLLLGAPEKVIPVIRHDSPANDGLADNTIAVFEYPKATAVVECAAMEFQSFPTRRFKISGTEGSIILTPLEPPAARLALRRDAGGYTAGVHPVVFPDAARHVADFADFAAAINRTKQFSYTASHDLTVQELVLRASGMPLT